MPAATSRTSTNAISGRVILKDTGEGLPGLVVVVYDVDPRTSPEEDFVRRDGGDATRDGSLLGDRLGSVLTSSDGSFHLGFDDADYRTQDATEKRPDLQLFVLAPEDADTDASPTALFRSKLLRQNSGRQEAYVVRISADQLRTVGLPIPGEPTQSANYRLRAYSTGKQAASDLEDGITKYNKTVFENQLKSKQAFGASLKASVAVDPSLVLNGGVFLAPGEAVGPKVMANVENGIDAANEQLATQNRGVPVNLYLTPDDLTDLTPYFENAVDGVAEVPESLIRPILFRATSSENPGTLLVNDNPIAKYCRQRTAEEVCAKEHLGHETGHSHDDGGTGGTEPDDDSSAVTGLDIPLFVGRLIGKMPTPDSVLDPGSLPARPTAKSVQESLVAFSLDKGPAEVPSYHDFHSLTIAFEHVWQQLFDEDLITTGFILQEKVLLQTGTAAVAPSFSTLQELEAASEVVFNSSLSRVPAHVAAHFDITKEEWNDLDEGLKGKLSEIAGRLDDSLIVTVNTDVTLSIDAFTKERYYQRFYEQGERLIDSVRHDDYYTMHKTLRDLHERLNSNYEYTIFAADQNHHSVNFGILNTFRQEWLPLNYQVGNLCKTIPLAPKEERKYSLKITTQSKRNEKNSAKTSASRTDDRASTSRVEGEIIAKAQDKTNFSLTTEGSYNVGISKGDAKTSLGIDAQQESQQTRKDFREAVIKAVQEYKDERGVEIETESSGGSEFTDSGTIVNPNDELAVTYLFYELQRRYRISEQLYRVMPVVLVAQQVPAPHEITEAWVIAHDWILGRFLLDESFRPSLAYLANKSVGDDFALRELRRNLRQQRNLVETLKTEFAAASKEADNKYLALLNRIGRRIDTQEDADGQGIFTTALSAFGLDVANPEAAKARELAASDEHKFAAEKAEKLAASLREEVGSLHQLTAEYNRTLRDHLDNETRTKRLLVHLRNHILYYMQGIWSMEPPDQRFLRLHKVQVPDLELDDADGSGRTYRVEVDPSLDVFAAFREDGTQKHKATMTGKLKKPFALKPLVEVADLDHPLGFKGNYMIFPMKEHNALTEFMAAPFIDSAFGAMDPDDLSNLNLNDFSKFICCLHDEDPEEFAKQRETLVQWLGLLLADPLRNGDELIVPSGSLYIEALPADHALLEDFKLKHRELDVFKAQAEVRKLELENLRYAARLLGTEYEDPDIEKKILVSGAGVGLNLDVDNG